MLLPLWQNLAPVYGSIRPPPVRSAAADSEARNRAVRGLGVIWLSGYAPARFWNDAPPRTAEVQPSAFSFKSLGVVNFSGSTTATATVDNSELGLILSIFAAHGVEQ